MSATRWIPLLAIAGLAWSAGAAEPQAPCFELAPGRADDAYRAAHILLVNRCDGRTWMLRADSRGDYAWWPLPVNAEPWTPAPPVPADSALDWEALARDLGPSPER